MDSESKKLLGVIGVGVAVLFCAASLNKQIAGDSEILLLITGLPIGYGAIKLLKWAFRDL